MTEMGSFGNELRPGRVSDVNPTFGGGWYLSWVDYDIVSECASNHALKAINADNEFSRRFNQDLERRLDDLAARIAIHLGGHRPENSERWERTRPKPKAGR